MEAFHGKPRQAGQGAEEAEAAEEAGAEELTFTARRVASPERFPEKSFVSR
jgi:hypothetical protein